MRYACNNACYADSDAHHSMFNARLALHAHLNMTIKKLSLIIDIIHCYYD